MVENAKGFLENALMCWGIGVGEFGRMGECKNILELPRLLI
jgi:hypothetical protein